MNFLHVVQERYELLSSPSEPPSLSLTKVQIPKIYLKAKGEKHFVQLIESFQLKAQSYQAISAQQQPLQINWVHLVSNALPGKEPPHIFYQGASGSFCIRNSHYYEVHLVNQTADSAAQVAQAFKYVLHQALSALTAVPTEEVESIVQAAAESIKSETKASSKISDIFSLGFAPSAVAFSRLLKMPASPKWILVIGDEGPIVLEAIDQEKTFQNSLSIQVAAANLVEQPSEDLNQREFTYDLQIRIKLMRLMPVTIEEQSNEATDSQLYRTAQSLLNKIAYKLPSMQKVFLSDRVDYATAPDTGAIVMRSLQTNLDEEVPLNQLVRSKILELPQQGLFFGLLNYKDIMTCLFPEELQGFRLALKAFQFTHLAVVQSEQEKAEPQTSYFEQEFKRINYHYASLKARDESYIMPSIPALQMDLATARLLAIEEVLDFIGINNQLKELFDPNELPESLERMKFDEGMRNFHMKVQLFLIQHMPYPCSKISEDERLWDSKPIQQEAVTYEAPEPSPPREPEVKSCLKSSFKHKDFQLNVKEGRHKVELNCFSQANAYRRENFIRAHCRFILKKYNKKGPVDEDEEMEEEMKYVDYYSEVGSPVKESASSSSDKPIFKVETGESGGAGDGGDGGVGFDVGGGGDVGISGGSPEVQREDRPVFEIGDDSFDAGNLNMLMGNSDDENLDFDNSGHGQEQDMILGLNQEQLQQKQEKKPEPDPNPEATEVKEVKMGLPESGEDFGFLKRNKVKFNCVEVVVNTYQKDPDELKQQKEFSEKYCS